jgi:hypothetical protein
MHTTRTLRSWFCISASGLALAACSAFAHPVPPSAGDASSPPAHGPRPPHPLSGLFDTDHDGIISAAEISAASATLGKLDRNHDGQITREELPPPPHPPQRPEGEEDDAGPPPPRPEGEAP